MLVVALVALLFCFPVTQSIDYEEFPHEIVKVKLKTTAHKRTIEFSAFGKKYSAIVEESRPPIHNHFQVLDSDGKEILADLDGCFSGHLKGSKKNRVNLNSIPGGAFLGFVKDGEDLIHLEPAATHIPGADKWDTIVYKEVDILKRTSIFQSLQNPLIPPTTRSYREKRENPITEHIRSGRMPSLVNEKKNRCPLKIVADHRFFNVVGKGDKATTARYILNTIARVNEIFQAVNWDDNMEDKVGEDRGRFFNFGFSIKELKIWDKPSTEMGHYNGNDTEYDGVWSSDRLLQAFTHRESSPKYCIVHLMTAQSFNDRSSLGLAYVATEDGGGICSDSKDFGERTGSYNTLITSVIGNSGKKDYPLVTREAEIVVAHEYGHSWGAVHDESKLHQVTGLNETCIPDLRAGGKYIMNPYAQMGYDSNNNKFSPCSVHMIRKMLSRRWSKCFEIEKDSLCGNGVVEDGEQCDEGALFKTDSTDSSCCSRNCTLLPSAQCSPHNSPCCSSFCSFHNASHLCLQEDTWQCKSKSFCSGRSGECPFPRPVKDGTSCAGEGECQNGNCLPYCESLKIGKKSCICEEIHLSCKRCCRANNGTGPCLPEEATPDLTDGSWCIQGYCKNSKCITEVADYFTNYFNPFQDGNIIWKMVKSNIVGIIVFISVPLWCIVGFYVTKYDQRQFETLQDRQIVNYNPGPSESGGMSPILHERSPIHTDFFSADDHF